MKKLMTLVIIGSCVALIAAAQEDSVKLGRLPDEVIEVQVFKTTGIYFLKQQSNFQKELADAVALLNGQYYGKYVKRIKPKYVKSHSDELYLLPKLAPKDQAPKALSFYQGAVCFEVCSIKKDSKKGEVWAIPINLSKDQSTGRYYYIPKQEDIIVVQK